ncbi:MAG TPA: hypothetical protein P5250_07985, partial [Bacteroidales bacterium]|nr:hypothetical protein [Bacteroidales bacterium]
CTSLVACNKFGEKLNINGGTLYYKSPVTKEEAQKLGEYLEETDFFDGTPKTLQLNKKDSIWILKIVVKKGTENDPEYTDIASQFSRELSYNVFDKKQVEIHLCNKRLETLRIVIGM